MLGAVSHFYPIPFPQSKTLLLGCVAGYIVCATVYYLIERNLEGDAFYVSKTHNINALKDFPRIRFFSDLDTHSAEKEATVEYTLKIQSESQAKGQKIDVERKFKVTTFFDEFGHLHRYKVKEAFEETLQKFINSPRK